MNIPKYWFVYSPSGITPPRFKHETEQSAITEAERLSYVKPGAQFHVLEFKGMHSLPVRKSEWTPPKTEQPVTMPNPPEQQQQHVYYSRKPTGLARRKKNDPSDVGEWSFGEGWRRYTYDTPLDDRVKKFGWLEINATKNNPQMVKKGKLYYLDGDNLLWRCESSDQSDCGEAWVGGAWKLSGINESLTWRAFLGMWREMTEHQALLRTGGVT